MFTVEVAIKVLAEGRAPLRYFANGWNRFDFGVVLMAYVSRRSRHSARGFSESSQNLRI